jgi:membrane protein DedA with SNARE-associated domain
MSAESALDLIYRHGPVALVLLMALNRFGIVPGGMFILITAGTLARLEVIDVPGALAAAYIGVMIGDSALYAAGRFGLGILLARRMRGAAWARAQQTLARWGLPAIFFTRWLIFPLTIAVSLLSGLNSFDYRRFLATSAIGNLLCVLLLVGGGYRFAFSWRGMLHWSEVVGARFVAAGPLSFGLLALLPLVWLVVRVLRQRRESLLPREKLQAKAVDPLF